MRTRSKVMIALIGVLLVAYALSSQILPTDKKKIQKAIEKARVGCEEEDVAAVMSLFAIDYSDELGLSKGAWFGLATRHFERYDNIRVQILQLNVDVEEDGQTAEVRLSARAQATLASTMGDPEALAEQRIGAADNALLHFRKEKGRWKLVRAEQLDPQRW